MNQSNFFLCGALCVLGCLLTGCGGGGGAEVPADSGNLAAPTAPADTAATSPRKHELNRTRRLQYKEAVAKMGGDSVSSHACLLAEDSHGPGDVNIASPEVNSSTGISFEFLNAETSQLTLARTLGSRVRVEGMTIQVKNGLMAILQRNATEFPTPTTGLSISYADGKNAISCGNEGANWAEQGSTGAYQQTFVKFKSEWPSMLNCSKAVAGSSISPSYQPDLQLTFAMGGGSIRLGDIMEVVATGSEILKIVDASAKSTQPTFEYVLQQDWHWSIGMDDNGYLQYIRMGKDIGGVTTAYDCKV